MKRGLAQLLPGALAVLLGKVPLEGHRPLNVKLLEIAVLGINLEPVYGLRSRVHGWLAIALRILQKGKILALDSFVVRIVFCHARCLLSHVTVYGGLTTLT